MDLYVNGEVLTDDIDDFVDEWHENAKGTEIFDFLGMTAAEYALWVREPDILPHIARARRGNIDLEKVVRLAIDEVPIAARSADHAKVKRLVKWLEQQGKKY